MGLDAAFWRTVNRRHAAARQLVRAARRFLGSSRGVSSSPPDPATPAFDLSVYSPAMLPARASREVAALGPVSRLPPGAEARRSVRPGDLRRLRRVHHLEDVAAFHPAPASRARALTRLAAAGVVVRLADGGPGLGPLLGEELHRLMAADARGLDAAARERSSVRMRRAALRNRAIAAGAVPSLSILLPTRRPEFLPWALDAVRRQTYPRLELVLALHGEGFGEVEPVVAAAGPAPAVTVKTVRVPANEPLGAALDAATRASSGSLLTKMDDDDLYGADHLWDLVLARQYSRARLVGKMAEFVYLAESDRLVRRRWGWPERWWTPLAAGAHLISRRDLDRVGGWPRAPRGIGTELERAVLRRSGSVYRTHGLGYVLVRHGLGHTWRRTDDYFVRAADWIAPGWNPALADVEPPPIPHPAVKARTPQTRRSQANSYASRSG